MSDLGQVNGMILDSVADTVTINTAFAPSQSFAMLDTVMIETLGMAMYNAVSRQQGGSMVGAAAVTAACAKMLQAPITSSPHRPSPPPHIEPLPTPPKPPNFNPPAPPVPPPPAPSAAQSIKDAAHAAVNAIKSIGSIGKKAARDEELANTELQDIMKLAAEEDVPLVPPPTPTPTPTPTPGPTPSPPPSPHSSSLRLDPPDQ